MDYVWLIIWWLVFGLLHSLFAASAFKRSAEAILKSNFKYYRLLYSAFATVNLVAVVWYHYSIPAELLWNDSTLEKTVAVVLGIPAVLIMGISIRKYFMNLSGIDVFIKPRIVKLPQLEQGGLHRYMRHPLYFGTLLFVWCIFLWQPSLANIISCVCITAYTLTGTYFEEKKLVQEFGEAYTNYRKKVPMLVPWL